MSIKTSISTGDLMSSVFNEIPKPWNRWFDTMSIGNNWNETLTIPAVNIVENKTDFNISLAAPGMKKSDFKIDVEGDMLTISAESKKENEEQEKKYTRKEYCFTSFSRSFTIPEGTEAEKIDARYEEGVLTLVLPKAEMPKKTGARQVAVK